MKLQNIIITYFLIFSINAFALNSNEVNQNLTNINNKISQVNSELNKQQNQQKNIDDAITYSDAAISQSNNLLEKLKRKKITDISKLNNTKNTINQLNQSLEETNAQTKQLLDKLYQKIEQIKLQDQTIIAQDNSNNNRKKAYLLAILKTQQQKLLDLQRKIDNLNQITIQIQKQIDQINSKLGITQNQQNRLRIVKQQQVTKSESLENNIKTKQAQLHSLKQQQAKLNQLMNQIIAREVAAKTRKKKIQAQNNNQMTDKNSTSQSENSISDNDSSFGDNSKLTSRITVKPINASIALAFGKMRDNVVNKGILYNYVANTNVHAITAGKVMYSGNLPGFGNVVIIDHGDNYMSIYSGITTSLKVGNTVKTDEVVGNTGNINNQPMGGFYFEIRHLGKPINPQQIIG